MRTLDWDELEPGAREAFKIWTSGSDFEWAKEAWSLLTKAGFCSYDSPRKRHIVIARFLALASIYRDWCSVAFDETQADEPEYWVEDLDVEPIYLGQLVRQELSDDPDEAKSDALSILLERERLRVVNELLTVYGGQAGLFLALYRSVRSLSARDPDDDDDEGGEDESDADILNNPTASNLAGYSWIVEGCPNVRPE